MGASPLFPPQFLEEAQAKAHFEHILARQPRQFQFGQPGNPNQTRWTLATLLTTCSWLNLSSLGGLAKVVKRLGFSWKGSRSHIKSPDSAYQAKRQEIERVKAVVTASAGKQVLVYLDEVTTYRQPTLAHNWHRRGATQTKAERSTKADTLTRIVAALNWQSGQVTYLRSTRIGIANLVVFYQKLRQAYPQAERIYLVCDNWPVHFHPDVLVALEKQTSPFQFKRPANWSLSASASAQAKWGKLALPIQLVVLPTYASWLNPIEKLWRWLKQSVLHLQRSADDLEHLRTQIDNFLDHFAKGSQQLLRYVGLCTD